MARTGDTLEVPRLGFRIVVRVTGEESDGELLELDVIGRPRGFIGQEHVHVGQHERHEVISGGMRLQVVGRDHDLRPGEAMEVPPGTPHRQLPAPDVPGVGHIRVQLRPAGDTLAFLERLAAYDRDGRMNRLGFPSPTAASELVRDFGASGHATKPPLRVQRVMARAVLAAAEAARNARRDYVFVDEWDVAAPIEAVYAALADASTYPEWWRPVYLEARTDGPPALGRVSHQHFKGRLPYHLHTRSRTTRLEPPRIVEGEVEGDLRGRGLWTLSPAPTGATHVRFDWRVRADRPLLRALTPILRPALRWNHDWAISRARAGLEPYAQRTARRGPSEPQGPPPRVVAEGA